MNNPKILYISCHEVLEYDELRMFLDLGLETFSIGAYFWPEREKRLRPKLPWNFHDDGIYEVHNEMLKRNLSINPKDKFADRRLNKEFVDRFDVIIIMHVPEYVEINWDVIKHKPVFWRSIGQSTMDVETRILKFRKEGLKIIRYSPKESVIPGFCGEDVLIRFGKYVSDFPVWNGNNSDIITLSQSMKKRGSMCGYDIWSKVTEGFPRILFGSDNKDADMPWKFISDYNELLKEMSNHRAYFYTGTRPASYTLNFMESMLIGMPIVAIGERFCRYEGCCTYEVRDILKDCGFCSNIPSELRRDIKRLLDDHPFASEISERTRDTAISLFSSDIIKERWKQLFSSL